MTVAASSIGIISIGLVLSISSGMDKYIQTMQMRIYRLCQL